MLAFSEACERNKQPILEKLKAIFVEPAHVLEVGSGTGQHAVFFAEHMPHLQWHCSDLAGNLEDINARLEEAELDNISAAVELDVERLPWGQSVDAVYSANTLHIMSWDAVQAFFTGVGSVLSGTNAFLCVYGPFRYNNAYTSDSNANFDVWLKQRDKRSGIRDFEAVDALAKEQSLQLIADHKMPANNQLLVWQRSE